MITTTPGCAVETADQRGQQGDIALADVPAENVIEVVELSLDDLARVGGGGFIYQW